MKFKIDFERIKGTLKPTDKAHASADFIVFIGIVFFYPIFLVLALISGMIAGYSPLKAMLLATGFYVFLAGAILFIRSKMISSAGSLYVPKDILGTVREDYSLLSAMLQRGEFDEAEAEAIERFVETNDQIIARIMGDSYFKSQMYKPAIKWYQKGASVAEKPVDKLYFLSLLLEIMDTHIFDYARAKMYMQAIAREFPHTIDGKEAQKRLMDPRNY